MKPIIGIISNSNEENRKKFCTNATYINAVVNAGGIPLMIPSRVGLEDCQQIIKQIDGLLIPGGGDIIPDLYGEETHPKVVYARRSNDLFEIELAKLAREHGKPLLGICRGHQVINVAFGGTLYQDIVSQFKDEICHRQSPNNPDEAMHKVYLTEDSNLAKILGKETIGVNTYHHQAVKDVAQGFVVSAKSSDGLIEAIETEDGMVIGVQWHPEILAPRFEEFNNLFVDFVRKCTNN